MCVCDEGPDEEIVNNNIIIWKENVHRENLPRVPAATGIKCNKSTKNNIITQIKWFISRLKHYYIVHTINKVI